jgi:VanZ family protein
LNSNPISQHNNEEPDWRMKKGSAFVVLKKKPHILLWTLCFSWLVFLLWLSSEDGVSTAYTSRQLSQLILKLFHLPQNQLSQVDQTIRTLAHFVGFFVMGGLSYTASKATWAESMGLVIKVITAGAVLAVLDEVKKLFITGRHLSWLEAGLNAMGIVFGVLFSCGIRWLIARVETKNRLAATRNQ